MNRRGILNQLDQNPLCQFADTFLRLYGKEKVFDSELLAAEFGKFFGSIGHLRKEALIAFLKGRLGIKNISPSDNLGVDRGINVRLAGKMLVLYKIDDWDGSQEFTIIHELRELIGYACQEVMPSFEDCSNEELENQADAFAAALLMESDDFYKNMLSSGFDPILLHKIYNKAYIAVVARMASVLRGKNPPLALWTSVLETCNKTDQGLLRAACFHRSPRYKPAARYKVPNFLFPKRGQLVQIDDVMKTAINSQGAVYIRRLRGLDFWNQYCLSVMIRPVIWMEQVAKLIFLALPEDESHLFRKQIQATNPIIIDNSFQML